MPYKRIGRKVLKKKGRKWVVVKVHETVEQAQKHLIALRIHVKD